MTIAVVAAVIQDGGRFLVTRRPPGAHLGGLWEFPGGKIDSHETHAAALRRELREELGADSTVGALILATTHRYLEKTVALHFYACTLHAPPRALLGQEMRWAGREELRSLPFPQGDRELIELLTEREFGTEINREIGRSGGSS